MSPKEPLRMEQYHRLRGSASPVLTATGFVNGKGQFSTPHRIDTPQPFTKKFQNYCIDSNQILHSDKDHQMTFVGGPTTRITNPRWRTAAILEKSKNCYISAAVQPILTKFGMVKHFEHLDRPDR